MPSKKIRGNNDWLKTKTVLPMMTELSGIIDIVGHEGHRTFSKGSKAAEDPK